ncbi:MAG: helix-turn-helix domain-containing protein [Aeriscardovia sp.]|nr:helix-turn-helix domain-containing protein [Aeriscardovia sp.]
MLKDNLIMLRNIHGYSQEAISQKIGISRQAYAKWETGMTIPNIEKCALLAKVYGISIDSLIRTKSIEDIGLIPPAPKDKNIWGSVTINNRGQIIIPKGARDLFGLKEGQRLIVLSNKQGIALIPNETFITNMRKAMEYMSRKNEEI